MPTVAQARPVWVNGTPCFHCGNRRAGSGRRGLCRQCYDRPDLRAAYPMLPFHRPGHPAIPCRHCRWRKGNRARQLCYACASDPAVRALYPGSGHPSARRGHLDGDPDRLPDRPTPAPPGTEAKIAEMERRAAAGVSLFHPADRPTLDGASASELLSLVAQAAAVAATETKRRRKETRP